ncbi:ParB/RepB/Spo0J family partition protein [Vibrio cholerae]|uniref:ParB/RepB/Spo0J family partition protein n=1 Tax=Vibrio cholerae TaxID=666 RepID=UPI00215BC85F|nr:ParB/RepB/Spo0J family partition protein [Vibrio cholerae]
MSGKGADLSGLDSFNLSDLMGGPGAAPVEAAEPENNNLLIREVPISKIHPDPNNSRQRVDPAKITELADSMKAVSKVTGKQRGVKNPLSLKPHPELEGEFMINAGYRRYLAAQEAGLDTVPAFIDSDADEYDNAVDNIQREGLTALEMAHFIQRQIDNGDKKSEIAGKLGKPASFVSDHISFFELPDCIRELYDSGRCVSVQALAILHRSFKNYPDEVETYCIESMVAEDGDELTTADVRRFCNDLKNPSTEPDSDDQGGAGLPGADGDKEPDSDDQGGAGWPGAGGDKEPDSDDQGGAGLVTGLARCRRRDSDDQGGAGWPGAGGDKEPDSDDQGGAGWPGEGGDKEPDSDDQGGAGWPGAGGDKEPDSDDQGGAGWPGAGGDKEPDSDDQGGAGWPGEGDKDKQQPLTIDGAPIGGGGPDAAANALLNADEQQGKIKKPIIQVRYDERPARLLSSRRAAYGLGWLKYDDDGEEIEVDLNQVQLVAVIEG